MSNTEISDREVVRVVTIKGIFSPKLFRKVEIMHSKSIDAYVLRVVTNVIDEDVCDDACEAIATLVAQKFIRRGMKVMRMSPCMEIPSDSEPISDSYFLVISE